MRHPLEIPRRLSLAGLTICVRMVDDLGDDLGQYRQEGQEIVLHAGIPRETLEATYLHELIEAADATAEIGLEHRQIEALAALLHQALTQWRR